MYDRDTAKLDQYDLTIKSVRKTRGGWLCTAQEGLFLWKESQAGQERLEVEAAICAEAEERGLSLLWNQAGGAGRLYMDSFVRNREGALLTEDDYGRCFVLKKWTEGRECEVRSVSDLHQGARAAACMHRILRQISPPSSLVLQESYEKLWERRRRELIHVAGFVRKRRNKNQFEQLLMRETYYYVQQIQKALELFEGLSPLPSVFICHGDFHYHNLIWGKEESRICYSSRFHLGYQVTDLYLFLRKCMEKQGWNWALMQELLDIYQSGCPLDPQEIKLLYCLFLFPEKYWKQMNFYVQSNKAWMPEKNVIKLKKLLIQEEKRQIFLENLSGLVLPF